MDIEEYENSESDDDYEEPIEMINSKKKELNIRYIDDMYNIIKDNDLFLFDNCNFYDFVNFITDNIQDEFNVFLLKE